jgi:hypothetical protein
MAQSIKGKLVYIKPSKDHWWGGFWGYVLDECPEMDEYFVGGGSITNNLVPCLCRRDLSVLKNQSIEEAIRKSGRVAL